MSTPEKARRGGRVALAFAIAGACVAGAVAVRAGGARGAASAASLVKSPREASNDDDLAQYKYYWNLYKYTIPVSNNTAPSIKDFVNATFLPIGEYACLGCQGRKVVADTLSGREVHWVDASKLYSGRINVEEWEAYFMDLNGENLDKGWNAFMHNKVVLYHPNVEKYYEHYKKLNVASLQRKSTGYSSKTYGDVDIAHILISIAGRMYEVTGPIIGDKFKETTSEWEEWGTDECRAANRLPTDLDTLSEGWDVLIESDSSSYEAWYSEHGFWPGMMIAVDVATANAQGVSDFWSTIAAVTNHNLTTLSTGEDECVATQFDWHTSSEFGWQPVVRYVENNAAKVGKYNLKSYDKHVETVHQEVNAPDWGSWDHWLDQHFGLRYMGSDGCEEDTYDVLDVLARTLLNNKVSVGQRTGGTEENKIHFYCGSKGTMAWEFNINGCEAYSREDNSDVCTCIEENNSILYKELYGTSCPDDCV